MSSQTRLSEGKLLFLLGAVQFVNVLDFMMVMPLGPDFARALQMPSSALGLVGGSYTAAAALSGLACALFLDRFDRKRALVGALLGLVLATASGGLAFDLSSLLLARVAAGSFGGPATALTLAIIADVVPIARRGRAMGAVMGAFSLASVLGVPAGLELARLGGWQLPFFAVAALGAVVALIALLGLPPLTAHLEARRAAREPARAGSGSFGFLARPTVLLSLTSTALTMLASFSLVPNLSPYMQFNLHYPRERLGLLYLAGGALSFLTLRLAGALSDRLGPAATATLGNLVFAGVLYFGFVAPSPSLPALGLFVAFMAASSFRMVPMQALSSRVPESPERARFMSAQSAVQHASSAAGAMFSARLLGTSPSGALWGLDRVASCALLLTLLVPLLLYALEARVAADARQRVPQAA